MCAIKGIRAKVAIAAVICLVMAAVGSAAAAEGVDLRINEVEIAASWVQENLYDWQVVKTADTDEIEVLRGETEEVDYTIQVQRNDGELGEPYHRVCVDLELANRGNSATEGLELTVEVSYGETVIATEVVTPDEQLARKSEETYTICAEYEPQAGTGEYTVKVTATDESGALAETDGDDQFTVADTLETINVDGTCTVMDKFEVPDGLSVEYADGVSFPQTFLDDGTYEFTVSISNQHAEFEAVLAVENTVTLTESGSGDESVDLWSVDVSTGSEGSGHTPDPNGNLDEESGIRGPGYWRNHVSDWPVDPEDEFYSTDMSWLEVLTSAPKGDAWFIYARHWITLHLNIEANEDLELPESVLDAYEAGADFFAEHGPGELAGGNLSSELKDLRQQILGWGDCLDGFNNGHVEMNQNQVQEQESNGKPDDPGKSKGKGKGK